MGEAGEAEFDKFQNEYGYLATEIYEDMKQTSHLLDIADQTHAKWHEADLGVLLVLPYEHVMAFARTKILQTISIIAHYISTYSERLAH